MSKIIGIDLGTTNSLVATVDSGIPFVMADAEGRRLTPSVVHFPRDGSDPIVGEKANRVRVLQPDRTIYSIKRFMGRRGSEVSAAEREVTYRISEEASGPVQIQIGENRFSPEEISAVILKKLKQDAEAALGEPVTRAVITVPAYFNDSQRNATIRAGELAGFQVERIVNEPTAAALAYGLNQLKDRSKIAVYDLGGGTFDLSILELNEGVFQVLSTHGNTRLGGDDLDRCVVNHLAERIRRDGGVNIFEDPSIFSRVREAAEAAKIRLSSETETVITLPFLTPAFSFSCTLTRHELEALTRDILLKTKAHCLRSLADANLAATDLDQVILVGGQTRMPLVRSLVTEFFGCVDFEETRGAIRLGTEYHRPKGPQLNTSQNPDEAVALGAAIQAEILSGGFKNVLLLDVTPLSLGIETFGGLMNVIIHRNSTIPTKAGEMFTTGVDYQRSMLIHVLQGEREKAADNWSLGKFTLDFEPALKGVPRVGVQFEIDANGVLHVLARDTKTGKEKVVQITSAVDVDDDAVQRMVEESVEHAFEDLNARRWIEAKLRCRETLNATENALQECRQEMEPGYLSEIEAGLADIRSILAAEHPETKIGDAEKLKTALKRLDEITKPLADHLMDKAMEAVLKKKGLL